MGRYPCDLLAVMRVDTAFALRRAFTTKRDKPAFSYDCRAMSLAHFSALSEYDATFQQRCRIAKEASGHCSAPQSLPQNGDEQWPLASFAIDRKSTRLNSSHLGISYAVFCLKKKKH